jgi:hypothetical protein
VGKRGWFYANSRNTPEKNRKTKRSAAKKKVFSTLKSSLESALCNIFLQTQEAGESEKLTPRRKQERIFVNEIRVRVGEVSPRNIPNLLYKPKRAKKNRFSFNKKQKSAQDKRKYSK